MKSTKGPGADDLTSVLVCHVSQAKLENQLEALRRRLEEESEARRKAEAQLQEASTQQVVVQQVVQPPPTPTTPAVTAGTTFCETRG